MIEYRGKPLEDYTKKELIEIVIEMGQMYEQSAKEHMRQLDVCT